MKYFIILLTGLLVASCTMDGPLPIKHDKVTKDKLVISPKKPDRFLSKDGVVYKCFR